jgi:hypothetical protein
MVKSSSDELIVKIIGCSGGRIAIAVTNPFAGSRARYTLWSVALNGGNDGPNDAFRMGRELPLRDCRRVAREQGYR